LALPNSLLKAPNSLPAFPKNDAELSKNRAGLPKGPGKVLQDGGELPKKDRISAKQDENGA
jgi:hypothetical protein